MRKYGNRRDRNEPEIKQALEAIGATVYLLDLPLDLLVGYQGRNWLLEVKDPEQTAHNRKLTPNQVKFFDTWKGQRAKVETAEEAIEIVTKP